MTSDERKVAMVTGASAGVGRAVAREFGRLGWRVGLLARNEDRLRSAQAEVEAAGGEGLPLPADVADADAVFAAGDRLEAAFGPPDVWVNCAMATMFSPAHEMSPAEHRRVIEVDYLGYVHGTLAALKPMRRRNAGTIVQVGSALAYRAIPLQSAYCAAKFAIRGFTDSLRSELLHEGSRVRLSMVQLPAVNTPQFDWARSRLPRRLQPLPPIFQPEAIAEAVRRAAIEAPRELWLGVPAVKAILGGMVAPPLLDRLLAERATAGQMTDEPASPRADNLFESVDGDYAAHGRFDARAEPRVVAFNPALLRGAAAACFALASGGLGYWLGRRLASGASGGGA
jgi:NAD(P)-dependent dehydrogenase (short-subunit alcohol dehydrogenase family)